MSIPRSACLFCKIVDGAGKADVVCQNETVCVIKDIRPAAKNHLLAISKEHIKDAKELLLLPDHKPLVENMISSLQEGLKAMGDDLSDVRYGFHWPPFHSVSHLHLHAISPASEMRLLSRMIFKENSYWFVSPDYVLSRL